MNISIFPLKLIVSIGMSILIYPPILILTLVNEIIRLVVCVFLKIFYNSKYQLVPDGADNIWHTKLKGNGRICLIFGITKDSINFEEFIKLYQRQIEERSEPDGSKTLAKLKKTFVRKFGYYCLRNDEESFDIRNHVKVYNLTKPADGRDHYNNEEFLNIIIPGLSQDMDESKPQWEDIIIPNVKLDDRDYIGTIFCHRWHHGFMDGVSSLLWKNYCIRDKERDQLTDEKSSYSFNPQKSLPFTPFKLLLIKSISFIMAPYLFIEGLFTNSKAKSRFLIPSYSGVRHFGCSEKIEWSLIKEIKDKTNGTVSAITATALSCAFSKLMEKYPHKQEQDSEKIPVFVVNAMVPYKTIKPQNRITGNIIPLPVGETSWTKVLMELDSKFRRIDPMFFISFYAFKWVGRFPWWGVEFMFKMGGPVQHISLSTIPLGSDQWNVLGCRIETTGGWPILFINNGLGIVIIRYPEALRYFMVCDDNAMKIQELNFCLKQVAKEIKVMAEKCKHNL